MIFLLVYPSGTLVGLFREGWGTKYRREMKRQTIPFRQKQKGGSALPFLGSHVNKAMRDTTGGLKSKA